MSEFTPEHTEGFPSPIISPEMIQVIDDLAEARGLDPEQVRRRARLVHKYLDRQEQPTLE